MVKERTRAPFGNASFGSLTDIDRDALPVLSWSTISGGSDVDANARRVHGKLSRAAALGGDGRRQLPHLN